MSPSWRCCNWLVSPVPPPTLTIPPSARVCAAWRPYANSLLTYSLRTAPRFPQAGLFVAGACGTPLNSAITYLSYLHISLQPYFYNEWQWAMTEMRESGSNLGAGPSSYARRSDEHKRLVRGLSACWCVGTLLRLVPCIPGTGTGECYYCAKREHFCAFDGSPACTYMGSLHIVIGRKSQN